MSAARPLLERARTHLNAGEWEINEFSVAASLEYSVPQ